MPRTINEGFRDFLSKLTPTETESQAAKRHRISIEQCLKANFGLSRFFRTGSFGNGTSISGYSDVDYFASIPTKSLKDNSDSTLREVRNALDKRFPDTGVRVNSPAVLVPFGNKISEYTEVVPADYVKKQKSLYIYDIPDGNGKWKKSSPDAHNAYVTYVNKKLGFKVKPLIRFLKAWRYYRNVSISSFYLELQATRYAAGEKTIIYSIDITNFLGFLYKNNLSRMIDPMEISGYISPCATVTQLEDAKSKLASAYSRAIKAREAEQNEKIKDAFYWWNLVFDNKFPNYYF